MRSLAGLWHAQFRITAQQRQSIYDHVENGSRISLEYAALVIFAALIALFGLLQNSAAVINWCNAYLSDDEPASRQRPCAASWGRKAGQAFVARCGKQCDCFNWHNLAGGNADSLNQASPEILARTTPNLLDLFIAFLAGLAGTLALRGGPSRLMIVPGVAVVVAVVPPLAVIGYGLSVRRLSIAGGAFFLFLTNLVAIVISAALVFYSMGFRPQRAAEAGHWKLRYRMAISGGVLLGLSIPLFLTLHRAVVQIRLRSDISAELDHGFRTNNASIRDLSLAFAGNELTVHATVRTTKYLDPSQIDTIQSSLQKHFGTTTQLQVDQMLVAAGGVPAALPPPGRDAISGGTVHPVEKQPVFSFESSKTLLVQRVQNELDGLLGGSGITRSAPVDVQLNTGPSVVIDTVVRSPALISPQTVRILATQLSSRLGVPVELKGRASLEGEGYHFGIEVGIATRALSPADRQMVDQLLRLAQSSPSLHLQINYTQSETRAGGEPPLLRMLRSRLQRAELKQSQWIMQELPLAEKRPSPASSLIARNMSQSTEKASARLVHYDFQVIQDF